MKVKILYSVEVEDLAKEVSALLHKPYKDLKSVLANLESAVSALEFDNEVNVEVQVGILQHTLTSIIAAANRIDDCVGILVGMKQVLQESKKSAATQLETPPELTEQQLAGSKEEAKAALTDG